MTTLLFTLLHSLLCWGNVNRDSRYFTIHRSLDRHRPGTTDYISEPPACSFPSWYDVKKGSSSSYFIFQIKKVRRARQKRAMRETEGRVKRLFFGFASVEEGTKQVGEGGGGRGGSDALPNFTSLNLCSCFFFFREIRFCSGGDFLVSLIGGENTKWAWCDKKQQAQAHHLWGNLAFFEKHTMPINIWESTRRCSFFLSI